MDISKVEAYAASWIEIMILTKQSRLRVVEAYVASWIEMTSSSRTLPQ